ncbi:MaoC-like dehydratase [Gonapodya prolifera JEL478]|uniref:MaoC-like dehydratase n=1 Tax=Gonapodya prolifera (strain JEL478) TaxID=1344416 RepID=A0A139AQG4_GONPJ|nr:MaoC-like dehydratase [Gonapodya prolifera JEL478]|eukprot:KXS18725.1 MaoC-like dehydratase [Gonapodya prolifera JEL478]
MPPVDTSKLPVTDIPVKYNKRDLILYAVGIGCDEMRFIYENDSDFTAFPTYPIVLPFRGTSFDVVDFFMSQLHLAVPIPGVDLDPTKVLDGERSIEFYEAIPLEADLVIRSRISNVYDVGKAAILENETQLVDPESGKTFVKMVGQAFFRDAGGFGGARPPKQNADATVPKRNPDKTITFKTNWNQAHIYRLSGDYNPLHVDPGFSSMVGFKKPILHGLCSWGIAARAVLKAFGDNDPANFVSYRGRFTAPVLPGETLQTEMWLLRTEGDKQTVSFQTKIVERNIFAIGGGIAVFKVAPKASL